MIQCKINKSKPLPERRVFTSRSYKDLDMSAFTSDLREASRCILFLDNADSQVEMYNTSIREVLNKHCPEKTRSQKLINNPKWYNDDVRDARRERRRTERRWRKTRSNEDRDKFIVQNTKVTELIKNVKTSYFKETLENANAKTMYGTLNMLLNSTGKKLPACFRSGSFPRTLRQAVVTPLIKKPTLNPDLLKNYRPVSNLPTLGKIIEYPAVSRLKNHLQVNNLTETYQSAYKSSHSTETALLRVKHDVLKELDKGKSVMLVLLDLSSAFDTIDHHILIERMQSEFGITCTAKEWFVSYLRDGFKTQPLVDRRFRPVPPGFYCSKQ